MTDSNAGFLAQLDTLFQERVVASLSHIIFGFDLGSRLQCLVSGTRPYTLSPSVKGGDGHVAIPNDGTLQSSLDEDSSLTGEPTKFLKHTIQTRMRLVVWSHSQFLARTSGNSNQINPLLGGCSQLLDARCGDNARPDTSQCRGLHQ